MTIDDNSTDNAVTRREPGDADEGTVVRVSRAAAAAARAQVSFSKRLGLDVHPAVAKIAALDPTFGFKTRKSDITLQ